MTVVVRSAVTGFYYSISNSFFFLEKTFSLAKGEEVNLLKGR